MALEKQTGIKQLMNINPTDSPPRTSVSPKGNPKQSSSPRAAPFARPPAESPNRPTRADPPSGPSQSGTKSAPRQGNTDASASVDEAAQDEAKTGDLEKARSVQVQKPVSAASASAMNDQADVPSVDSEGQLNSNWNESAETFDDMELPEKLLRGIYAHGFERPSPIQQKGVIAVKTGRDLIAQSQSGTGKTGCFTTGLLSRIEPDLRATQALVLAPTRELAKQTYLVTRSLSEFLNIRVHLCVGGSLLREDVAALRERPHVVIGTPGRIQAMLEKGCMNTNLLKTFVLDEADEMLSRGFRDQIYDMFQLLPRDVQVCLFSATMPGEILDIARKFMRQPIRILIKAEEVSLEGIKQFYVDVGKEANKLECLLDIYEQLTVSQAIIFCNSRRRVEWLSDELNRRDFTVSMLHSDMTQAERSLVMTEFRTGSSRVLISTDLIARGIDVCSVNLVVNYDIPFVAENYIHRVGRSGRFGRKGAAINFVTADSARDLRAIQHQYSVPIDPLDLAELHDATGM